MINQVRAFRDSNNLPPFEREDEDLSSAYKELFKLFPNESKSIIKDGYTVLNLSQKNDLFETINAKIDHKIFSGNTKLNPKYYHYNENPRIIEAWKDIPEIAALAYDSNVMSFLKLLYQRNPIPFSTINFIKSSEQPLHSDYMHFSSKPERYLTGVWFALEDIDIDSGPLQIIPGSHKLQILDLEELNQDVPKNTMQLKKNYTEYEEHVAKVVKDNNLESKKITLKKNQCLVWAANLLHGGSPINNHNLTRKSLVVHYHYENCFYYNPSFSKLSQGIIAERKIEQII